MPQKNPGKKICIIFNNMHIFSAGKYALGFQAIPAHLLKNNEDFIVLDI
jgi:hypothetical protein